MSEKLERWKAAEKVRSFVGPFAILMGVGGALSAVGGLVLLVLRITGIELKSRIDFFGAPFPELLTILTGIALLLCSRGLWKAEPWARWVTVALCVSSIADSVLLFVNERAIDPGVVFPLSVLVFLLLPSTGRHFARAQGSLPQAEAS